MQHLLRVFKEVNAMTDEISFPANAFAFTVRIRKDRTILVPKGYFQAGKLKTGDLVTVLLKIERETKK